MYNYLYALAENWPDIKAHSADGGLTYEGLVNDGEIPLPTKTEIDEYLKEKARAEKWEQLKAYRELRRQSGVLVSGHWYHSDDTSRIQVMGLTMLGASMPPGIMWKTIPNTFVEMTPTRAQEIFQAILNGDMTNFSIAEQHRQQLLASADPANYDFTTSPAWPAIYGE